MTDTRAEPTSLLVTGCSRGIGLELTRQALARGDRVIATCRRPDGATELSALQAAHAEALTILPLDVTDDASVQALAAAVGLRTVDVLVNNAGIYGGNRSGIADVDYAAWAETFAVNAMAPLRVSAALLPALRRSARPRIVTISSIMGSMQREGTVSYVYCSSKAAANKVTKLLAQELREERIVAVPLHPGWVRTDMGGPEADLAPEDSAAGLLSVIDGLTIEDSGRFLAWDGEVLPW